MVRPLSSGRGGGIAHAADSDVTCVVNGLMRVFFFLFGPVGGGLRACERHIGGLFDWLGLVNLVDAQDYFG